MALEKWLIAGHVLDPDNAFGFISTMRSTSSMG